MENTKIYLDLSDDVRDLLKGVSLQDILEDTDIELPADYEETEDVLPATEDGEKTKDLVSVILASAAAGLALSASAGLIICAISKYLKDREMAPQMIECWVEKEVTGADGKTRTQLVLEKKFIQPEQIDSTDCKGFALQFSAVKGIVLKFGV